MTERAFPPPRPAADPCADELACLLAEPLASALSGWTGAPPVRLRERLLGRVARSARAASAFVTVRRAAAAAEPLGPGVQARHLYDAGGDPRRPGEPRRVRLIEIAPGSIWSADEAATGDRDEWLLLAGRVEFDGELLGGLDYRHHGAGAKAPRLRGIERAIVYRREAPQRDASAAAGATVRHAETAWEDFGPGIRRRVLWRAEGEASLLYHSLPGASVPAHGHDHDEECLMVDGELFLDDVLLRRWDWQLAPAGSRHGGVYTDTGVVLFAHGDLDLKLHPAA